MAFYELQKHAQRKRPARICNGDNVNNTLGVNSSSLSKCLICVYSYDLFYLDDIPMKWTNAHSTQGQDLARQVSSVCSRKLKIHSTES